MQKKTGNPNRPARTIAAIPSRLGRADLTRRLARTTVLTGLILATTHGAIASAGDSGVGDRGPTERALPAPGDAAWQPLLFRNIETPTRYEVREGPEGRPAYRATSECGASALTVALPADLDAARWPRLAWRWRVERGLDVPDEKSKAGDDFAARVYVMFPFDPERASTFERLQRGLGRRLFGVEMPGLTLNYVWTSRVPVGEAWTSPYHADAVLAAVESSRRTRDTPASGPDSGWRETIVDWAADAQRRFAAPPRSQPYALGIMVDADGTCESAVAWFADFRLLGPQIAPVTSMTEASRAADSP